MAASFHAHSPLLCLNGKLTFCVLRPSVRARCPPVCWPQVLHPRCPWDLDHLLQFQWNSKVVLTTSSGLELKGGLYKVRQVLRDGDGALQEGSDVVL